METYQIKKIQEEQSRLISDIAHNLQTPLTILQMELSNLSDKYPSAFDHLHKSVEDISYFITRITNIAKQDLRVRSHDYESTNLSELLVREIVHYNIIAEANEVQLLMNVAENIYISAYVPHIKDVIANLIGNSVKYRSALEDSEIQISLSQKNRDVLLTISDNGVGMNTYDRERVFDRFYRGLNALETEGHGLGLSICKKIVEQHGGTITLESELGQGTTVTVTFPAILTT